MDAGVGRLNKDRIEAALARAAYHTRLACAALIRLSYLLQEESEAWFTVSVLYSQYVNRVNKTAFQPVGYRRFSDIMAELENLGLAESRNPNRSAQGYGRQYRLTVPPETIGETARYARWWAILRTSKERHEVEMRDFSGEANGAESEGMAKCAREALKSSQEKWRDFVGLEIKATSEFKPVQPKPAGDERKAASS